MTPSGNANYPAYAVQLLPNAGPTADDLTVNARILAGVAMQTDMRNASVKATWDAACAAYLTNAALNRTDGQPLPVKPVQPTLLTFETFYDPSDQSTRFWQDGSTLMQPPCPDLPPLPVGPTQTVIAVGVALGLPGYYQSLPQDTVPVGQSVVTFTSQGVHGKFWKYGDPWGSWYTIYPPIGQ